MTWVQPVSLCGARHAYHPSLTPCFESWARLIGAAPFQIFDDGTLDYKATARLKSFGHDVIDSARIALTVEPILRRYPSVLKIRNVCPLFRKIVDPALMYPHADRILFVDTDVYFASRFRVDTRADFVFGVDDVSGYAGAWVMPLFCSVVLGLNSGFMLYTPKIVDLDLLDKLVARYLLKVPVEMRWWTEQAAWAVLGARAKEPRIFDGRDYCVIGGLMKRTVQEIRAGRVKWFARNTPATDEYVSQATANVAVIHFAGSGRRYIEKTTPLLTTPAEVRVLRTSVAAVATRRQRIFLAARLGIRGVIKRRWTAEARSACGRVLGRSVHL